MRDMMRLVTSVCVILLLVGCAGRSDYEAISDDQLGLSKTDVRDVPAPDPVVDDTSEPGEGGVLPRAYDGAPPTISEISCVIAACRALL